MDHVMGQTSHDQICHKLKGEISLQKPKPSSKGNNISTCLIEYFPKTLVKKKSKKNQKG